MLYILLPRILDLIAIWIEFTARRLARDLLDHVNSNSRLPVLELDVSIAYRSVEERYLQTNRLVSIDDNLPSKLLFPCLYDIQTKEEFAQR